MSTPKSKKILCNNVGKSIKLNTGQLNLILKDISFTWTLGEAIGLIGLNGAGKTTLLRMIGNFEEPTTGNIKYSSKNVRVAVVFQRPEDHFIFDTVNKQIRSQANRRIELDEYFNFIKQIGLSKDILLLPPHSLSSGQQRLVAIASALVKQIDFLILDEPMAGLDAPNRKLVLTALENFLKDNLLGLMVVSHHLDDLLGLVNRLLIIDNKTLLYDGSLDTVPLEALYACLAKTDPSLLLLLKRLEDDSHRITTRVYNTSSLHQLAEIIEDMLKR